MLVGPDEQNISSDRRCSRCSLAELGVRSQHLGLVGACFEDGHGPVIQRCEVDMTVGGDWRGVVLAGGNRPFLVNLRSSLGIVRSYNSAVLHHYVLPVIHEGGGDVGYTFRLPP